MPEYVQSHLLSRRLAFICCFHLALYHYEATEVMTSRAASPALNSSNASRCAFCVNSQS